MTAADPCVAAVAARQTTYDAAQPRDEQVHDILGIGFGPSNIALAIAVEEHNRGACADEALDVAFVERQASFGWHGGMLIDDATMQVSFLKDLATMRNPTSDFSFVSYLHECGRLADFMNHKTLFPLRIEFHDYLEWAARRLDHLVTYGSEVVDVQPVTDGESICAWNVIVRHGDRVSTRRARNLVIAVGLELRMPADIARSTRIWHSSELLQRVESLPAGRPPRRFVVLGAGQSAAEVVSYLHRRFPDAETCSVFARFGYTPADDSPFANRIFDPESVDHFFSAPAAVKRMLLEYHGNTNYSVVDSELITELYRRAYQEKVLGQERLRIMHASRVIAARETADEVLTTIECLATDERVLLEADALVCATGYRAADPVRLLGCAGAACLVDTDGYARLSRDYRIATSGEARAGIYVQGATEHSHGIGSTLLSNTATRAGEILDSILLHVRRGRHQPPTLVATGEQG